MHEKEKERKAIGGKGVRRQSERTLFKREIETIGEREIETIGERERQQCNE